MKRSDVIRAVTATALTIALLPVTGLLAAARAAADYFPAIASTSATPSVTGPIVPVTIYFNVLHYGHATLTSKTVNLEPPEIVKFLSTPPRALGFGAAQGSAFDILSSRATDWATKAKQAQMHYRADLAAFAAVETAFKQYSAEADKDIGQASPGDASLVIGQIVQKSVGPNGRGAALAKMLGFTVNGTAVQRDPTAPMACDLGAPTYDGSGAPVFVAIPDSCIQTLIDDRLTLLDGILRAVIEVNPNARISAAQADYLKHKLDSYNLTSIAPNGSENTLYAAKSNAVQLYITLLASLKAGHFELTTDAGKCGGGLGGTKTTITFSATDRFTEATAHNDVLIVTCYPRLAASAGIAYTTVPKTTFSVAQTAYPLNGSSGVPPGAVPTFQSTYQIASNSGRTGRIAGMSLLHLCLCDHPYDGVNLYITLGLVAPDGQPLGIITGISAGFAHRYYLTIAEHYGTDNVLVGNTGVGALVPQGYILTTRQQRIMRPTAALTIGL